MRISLGPAPLNWGEENLIEFYKTAINSEIDDFYLGEVICSERLKRFKAFLINLAHMIKDNNKKLYISSYALVTKLDQLSDIRELLEIADGIEVNSFSYLDIAFKGDLIAGPFLNIYNSHSVEFLSKIGFKRVVLPYELSLASIKDIVLKSNLEIEVFASGRVPLAISKSCYTMRAAGKYAARCQIACLKYPEGLTLETLDGMSLFRINGKEILSDEIYSFVDRSEELEDSGVSMLRVMPQMEGIPI